MTRRPDPARLAQYPQRITEIWRAGLRGFRRLLHPGECYRYANQYLSSNFPGEFGADEPVLFSKDDVLIATDPTAHLFPELVTQIDSMRAAGRSPASWCMIFCHYAVRSGVSKAFSVISDLAVLLAEHADRLICVSASVAEDVKAWIAENRHWVKPNPLQTVSNFHLGADLDASVPSTGMPDNAQALLAAMAAAPSFIMVGTMEPRKVTPRRWPPSRNCGARAKTTTCLSSANRAGTLTACAKNYAIIRS